MIKNCFQVLALIFLHAISADAQKRELLFKNNDRVCFIGNSITHSGSYHPDIFLYYATRFPGEKVFFFNCGVSGDMAGDILARLERDVLARKPTVAVLMVGINDMIDGFSTGKDGKKLQKEQRMADAFELYKKSVTQLAEKLTEYNCRLILELPSIYDQTVKNSTVNMFGVNDALGNCAAFLRALAPRYNATVVDYWTIMKDINEKEQKKDSSFSIVGQDRVHPGAPGHLVMAYQFLKTTGAPKYVSRIGIDVKTERTVEEINCTVKIQRVNNRNVEFMCLQNALPYPVDKEAIAALDFVPFIEDLNQEILQVNNLYPGSYSLFIDGENAGTYTSSDLGKGINLSMDTLTPQYRQAVGVMNYCNEYRKLYSDLRTIAVVEYRSLQDYNGPDNPDSKRIFLNEKLEKIKGEYYYEYVKGKCENYFVLKPQEQQLNDRVNKMRDFIYDMNKPKIHSYKITFRNDSLHPDAKLGRAGNRTTASLYDLIKADKQSHFICQEDKIRPLKQ